MMHAAICPFPIRQLTAKDLRDRQEEARAERYRQLCDELEDADRAEYEEQFGEFYRARNPFKANAKSIHDRVTAMMKQDGE